MRAPACGGCDRMFLTAEQQRARHVAEVRALLAGAFHAAGSAEIVWHAPSAELGYRSRARLFVRARGGRAQVGYRAARSHRLVTVQECIVLRAELVPVLAQLTELCAGSRGSGEAAVALGDAARPVVELSWEGELDAAAFARADALVKSGRWAGARLWLEDVREPASFGDARAVLAGADGRPLRIAAGGFAQPSDEGGAALALRAAALLGGGRVVELFAGSGTLTVAAAAGASEYLAVEQNAEAAAALEENVRARGLAVRVVVADADAWPLPRGVDATLLDPPRIGAAGAVQRITKALPRVVVYVSCWPQSLARDLQVLARAGYTLADAELFDLFPQTGHVETMVRLRRA
jgi:23S rRNA (uracil1939-C5)-methyltransferase